MNRRFGSRILFNTDIISSLCFIGSFSLFIPLPLQLYLSCITIDFYSILFLYSFIFRHITSHPFSHLLTLFLCILFRRRNPYPGYRNMSTNCLLYTSICRHSQTTVSQNFLECLHIPTLFYISCRKCISESMVGKSLNLYALLPEPFQNTIDRK